MGKYSGEVVYLDRHNVSCNHGFGLSRVHLKRCSRRRISYEFTCCEMSSNVSFPTSSDGDGRHNGPFKYHVMVLPMFGGHWEAENSWNFSYLYIYVVLMRILAFTDLRNFRPLQKPACFLFSSRRDNMPLSEKFFETPGGVLGFIWGGMFVSSSCCCCSCCCSPQVES